jgi:cytochrome c
MKKLVCAALIASLGVIGSHACAADGGDAAKKAGCSPMCHAPATKGVGPSWKDIAAKYAGQADAQAKLETKVRAGGSGSFSGTMPPTNKSVSDADIKAIVAWVLTQK